MEGRRLSTTHPLMRIKTLFHKKHVRLIEVIEVGGTRPPHGNIGQGDTRCFHSCSSSCDAVTRTDETQSSLRFRSLFFIPSNTHTHRMRNYFIISLRCYVWVEGKVYSITICVVILCCSLPHLSLPNSNWINQNSNGQFAGMIGGYGREYRWLCQFLMAQVVIIQRLPNDDYVKVIPCPFQITPNWFLIRCG